MIELLLSILLTISPAVAQPAPEYDIKAGTRGFTAYSVESPVAAAPQAAPQRQAPDSTTPVEPLETTEELVEVRTQPQPASRSGRRTPPPEAKPVSGGLLSVAAAYVGYPYVLYGTPPAAFDCSAYTWYVFKQAGIDIPRSVNGQKAAVTPVSDPQPGDLVFYNDYHHVGIYAGNGMTYEALNPSTGVRYGKILTSNVWYGRP